MMRGPRKLVVFCRTVSHAGAAVGSFWQNMFPLKPLRSFPTETFDGQEWQDEYTTVRGRLAKGVCTHFPPKFRQSRPSPK